MLSFARLHGFARRAQKENAAPLSKRGVSFNANEPK
jgi:hypothetical protein